MGTGRRLLALVALILVAAADPPPKPAVPAAAQPAAAEKSKPDATPPATVQPPAADAAAADVAAGAGTVFQTRKTLADLEKCLTDKLSQGGEVTSVPIEGVKTLMYRTTDEPAMMIDLAPPTVKVTTKFAIGTEPIVKSCL